MTQAYNLSQLANKVNTSGKLEATTGLHGGTGNNGKYLRANTDGSVVWDTVSGSSALGYALYHTVGSGTWTCPTGVTKVKVTVIGGGGGGYSNSSDEFQGGPGGAAIGIYQVTPGTGYAYTVGAGGTGVVNTGSATAGGSSSFASLISATGGGAGSQFTGLPGANGSGTGGTITNNSVVPGSVITTFGIRYCSFYSFSGRLNDSGLSNSALLWTPTSVYCPGAPGLAQQGVAGRGGVSGLVYIEYVDGVGIGSTGSIGDYALYSSGSGTWTCPPGVTKVKVTCIGGGGVSQQLNNLPFGGLAIGVYTVTPGTGYAYTVGAGGIPSGTITGGTSSLAGLCSATGGTVAYGTNVPGVGSGGTFTNSSVASSAFVGGNYPFFVASAIPPFAGAIANKGSALVWTPTSGLIPGAAGAEWDQDNMMYSPRGGVGGAILIEYLG